MGAIIGKYIWVFLISMVPLIELRGAIPYGVVYGLPLWLTFVVAIVGNMLPVPLIYFFARKVLHWGADKKYIGKFFSYCLEKGEAAGHRLMKKAGRGGLFVALMLRGMRIAVRCSDKFGTLLAAGITSSISVQAFLNMGVVVGILPTTGLPLPFFSAGGTSISITMAAIGILLNISRESAI